MFKPLKKKWKDHTDRTVGILPERDKDKALAKLATLIDDKPDRPNDTTVNSLYDAMNNYLVDTLDIPKSALEPVKGGTYLREHCPTPFVDTFIRSMDFAITLYASLNKISLPELDRIKNAINDLNNDRQQIIADICTSDRINKVDSTHLQNMLKIDLQYTYIDFVTMGPVREFFDRIVEYRRNCVRLITEFINLPIEG